MQFVKSNLEQNVRLLYLKPHEKDVLKKVYGKKNAWDFFTS